MKSKVLKLSTIVLLYAFIGVGCQKEEAEWEQINPINPDANLNEQLDSMFSKENNCLINFEEDTIIYTIFSEADYNEIDSCNDISGINFEDYTLIVGKIKVASISDEISSIILTSNNSSYLIEVSIDKCVECWGAIGYIYFWRLYPKLQTEFETSLSVSQTIK